MPTGRQEVISLVGVSLNASPVGRPVYCLHGDLLWRPSSDLYICDRAANWTHRQDYVHGALE
jgi:hypothetical protein